jgi:hypothetical protein
MNYINWGGETPEQLAIRRRLEEIALMEQAAAWVKAKMAQSGAVGGGSNQTQKETDPSQNNYVENGYIDNYFE